MREKLNKIQIKNKKNDIKLKGTAKIQLFNSETGALEYEKVEANMITNAYFNLINPDWVQNKTNISILNYMPIKNLFGGVILMGESIEEDLENIIPNKLLYDSFVGNAGSVYGGTSKYRGTINNTESVAIDNGYRFVWDFPTNCANGPVKSIALTSVDGGNVGLRIDKDNDYSTTVSSIGTLPTSTFSKVSADYTTDDYICHINQNTYLRFKVKTAPTITIEKVQTNETIKLTETTNGTTITAININVSKNYTFNRADNSFIYGNNILYNNTTKQLTINTIKISKTDFSVVENTYTMSIELYIGTSTLITSFIKDKVYITKTGDEQLFIIDLIDPLSLTYVEINLNGNKGCSVYEWMDTVIIMKNKYGRISASPDVIENGDYYVLGSNNDFI